MNHTLKELINMDNTEIKKLLLDIPIKLCRNMINEFIKSAIKDLNVNFSQHHFMILRLLQENKQLHVKMFVEILGITKSQMTALVDQLINMGYIIRKHDTKDRRKIYISLTLEGKEITTKIKNYIDNQIDMDLSELNQEELVVLRNGLLVLNKLSLNHKNSIK